jgi:hypothetical protein
VYPSEDRDNPLLSEPRRIHPSQTQVGTAYDLKGLKVALVNFRQQSTLERAPNRLRKSEQEMVSQSAGRRQFAGCHIDLHEKGLRSYRAAEN